MAWLEAARAARMGSCAGCWAVCWAMAAVVVKARMDRARRMVCWGNEQQILSEDDRKKGKNNSQGFSCSDST